jgi:hypothetical protein
MRFSIWSREKRLQDDADAEFSRIDLRASLILWVVFAGVALFLYGPALGGPLHGDDFFYLDNPFMQELTLENALAILDPMGEPAKVTTNYAPVHLFAHLLENAAFGGYGDLRLLHSVNVVLHALNAALLVALVSALAVPLPVSIAAGTLFLLHPANVEAVAWVTQLKTTLAFAFSMSALLLYPRRPGLACVAFAMALLSKFIAACVLPAMVLFEWVGVFGTTGRTNRLRCLGASTLILALCAIPSLSAFQHSGQFLPVPLEEMERLQRAVAIVARYAVLVVTGLGASINHEPKLPTSLLDPWWLGGLAMLGVLVGTGVAAVRRRHPALPWLAFAAVAYAPIAQVFPFKYPMADRYLYFVLPGLLGAAAVTASPWLNRAWREVRQEVRRPFPVVVLLAAAIGTAALSMVFADQTHRRAEVWRSLTAIVTDAAMNYPHGQQAAILYALASINRGDPNGALDGLEAARARGYVEVRAILSEPAWGALHGHPRFVALVHEMTHWWIEQKEAIDEPNQFELIELAQLYLIVGELEKSEQSWERALAAEGSADPAFISGQLEHVRRLRTE